MTTEIHDDSLSIPYDPRPLLTHSTLSLRKIKERIISAGIGATLVSLLVTPLDVVKVRLQSQPSIQPRLVFCGHLFDSVKPCLACPPTGTDRLQGTMSGILRIGREEGVVGLYRGLLPTLLMSLPATVVYFVGYEAFKEHLSPTGKTQEMWVPLVSGSVARIFAATTIAPLELLKTRMQSKQGQSVRTQLSSLYRLVKTSGGLPVLFRGLYPTLWRDVPFSGIYWSGYEFFQSRLSDMYGALPSSFMAGAISGAIAATLTIPFDVVKTRKQVSSFRDGKSPAMWSHLGSMWREEGVKGMTRGLVPRVAKVSPACAIMISSYELSKILLSSE